MTSPGRSRGLTRLLARTLWATRLVDRLYGTFDKVRSRLVLRFGSGAFFDAFNDAAYGGQASLGMGDPYLFQSIAAVVIGGVSILGGRGNYLGSTAGSITLVALVTLLLAENMPDWGRDVVYGGVILVILLLYGREKTTD